MTRTLLIAVAVLCAGLVTSIWAGGELFSAALRADRMGTSGQLSPLGIGVFGAGLLAASGGLVAATYTSAKWFRGRHQGPRRREPR